MEILSRPMSRLLARVVGTRQHLLSGLAATAVSSFLWGGFTGLTEAARAETYDVRVGARFLSPTSVEIRWESNVAAPAVVNYGPTRKLGTLVDSSEVGTSHRVVIEDLRPATTYHYRIGVRSQGKRLFSPFYQMDGQMNYSPPLVKTAAPISERVKALVQELPQAGGFAMVLAQDADQWALPLAATTSMSVVALCDDAVRVQELRQQWYSDGQYGIRLSAQLWEDVPRGLANVVVCDAQSFDRIGDLLSPSGVVLCLTEPPKSSDASGSSEYRWERLESVGWIGRRGRLETLAEWGHQYGSAANASFSGETLQGADETEELEVRWLGRPGADFGIDRNPRMPAPLAVGGRLFHQGMNRMIALDAFNGAVLWSLEIPDLRRVNLPRDCANWCADRERVYAVTRDCLWVIDAATGEMLHTMRMPGPYADGHDWGYVAVTDDILLGSAIKSGSAYEDYWDKAAWYDGSGDAATSKVCANAIVAFDKKYGDVLWQYEMDAAVQSTITVLGDHLYFVESEDPALREWKTGKLTNKQIWKSASVVCLDLKTGKRKWKKSVPAQADDQIIAFGIADQDQFVLETSSGNEFHFASFDSRSGEPQWSRSVKWPSDNHGAHMQHAVLMNGKLFVQPHILDATDGKVLQSGTLGKRRGCATPIGTGGSILYRGGSGPVSMWSLDRGKASEFTRLRPSCWLSTIPAQGMLFSPEAGGGCSCGGWMECSIGFAPKLQSEGKQTDDKQAGGKQAGGSGRTGQ